MKEILVATILVFMLTFLFVSLVFAQSPQEVLTQYISDLQNNPDDYALREKIIKHVQTMSPVPLVPSEAEKFGDRGEWR